jgi:hypothetical protein
MFGSLAALAPTFAVGLMLDVLPVAAVLEIVAVTLIALALVAWLKGLGRRMTPDS